VRLDRSHTRKELHSIICAVLTSEDQRNLLALGTQSRKFVERRLSIRPCRDVIVVAIAAVDLAHDQIQVRLVAAQDADQAAPRG
jgi:hypothetical protein